MYKQSSRTSSAKIKLSFLVVTLVIWAQSITAESFDVAQENKAFSKDKLTIKVGDKVKFINLDPFFHNVFSLSDAKFFDLGSFPKGEFKEVEFSEAGSIEVECAIHPNMLMTIEVTE